MKSALALIALAVIVVSCGPVYTTNYNLLPAPTKDGQLCSANVKMMADTCIANCQQMARNCRGSGFNAGVGFGGGSYRQGGWGYNQSLMNDRDCISTQCEESCMTAARQGHLNCGGRVVEEVICTSNCPESETK